MEGSCGEEGGPWFFREVVLLVTDTSVQSAETGDYCQNLSLSSPSIPNSCILVLKDLKSQTETSPSFDVL